MSSRQEIDALAEKIAREIESFGACSLQNQELAALWGDDAGKLSLVEKQMHLANFSIQYGFVHHVDEGMQTVSFRI